MEDLTLMTTGHGSLLGSFLAVYFKWTKIKFGLNRICNGHVAVTAEDLVAKTVTIDTNISKIACDEISTKRKLELNTLRRLVKGYNELRYTTDTQCVPVGTDLYANVVFRISRGEVIPEATYEYYKQTIIDNIPRAAWPTFDTFLSAVSGNLCVPRAILKCMIVPATTKIVVGKLGFKNPARVDVDVYDWEYGGDGVQWV
jgi:uncharacterized membrane protein